MLKCDEKKPTCGQCTKARQECKPSPGIVFRHQQNASLNGDPEGGLEHFYGYKKSFGTQSTWVDIPKRRMYDPHLVRQAHQLTPQVSFVQVTDPYSDDAVNDLSSPEQSQPTGDLHSGPSRSLDIHGDEQYPQPSPAYGLEALSAAATSESYHYPEPDALLSEPSVTSPKTKADSRSTSAQDLSYILNPSPTDAVQSALDPHLVHASQIQPQTHSRHTSLGNQRLSTRTLYQDDGKVGFFLRHFSEVPGHWMDLFDLGRFFEMEVIVKAARCPLLLHSAIALSAKSLGRLDRCSKRLREAPFSDSNAEWLHIARIHYDRAIHLLRQALEAETRSPVLAHSQVMRTGWEVTGSITDDSLEGYPLPGANDDELVGTTAILCVYEFLDASREEWSRHLDGAKSLFDITKDGVLAMATAPSRRRYSNSRPHSGNSRAAIFWNLARQDMLDAFMKHSASRLNTADETMWRTVGLHIDDAGWVLPSNDPDRYPPMEDDMICNSMVWIVMQVVNFIASVKEEVRVVSDAHGVQARLKELSSHLSQLTSKMDTWFAGLPDSFRPICSSGGDSCPGRTGHCAIPKKWFVRPMCASTMEWYHFARIQLLHCHQFISSGLCIWSNPTLLRNQEPFQFETLAEGREHAMEIISINLAQTDEGVLVHSVQPLFAAGQMLRTAPGEVERALMEVNDFRTCLVEHMRWIERETGWATNYRVNDLIELWAR